MENGGFVRSHHGALLNTNAEELARYRDEIKKSKRIINLENEIRQLKTRMEEIEKRLNGQNS